MAKENPIWGVPRIHGDLLKLGFEISERTVSRYLARAGRKGDARKLWLILLIFLRNHREVIAAMDFFTVPTATFRLLYCFFVIRHSRRRVVHFNATEHPTSQWVVQQLREAFPIDLVRQSSKRLKTPRTLTPVEFKALVGQLGQPYKTMVVTITCLGLRVCELLALQWGDIDFESLTVRIQQSIVAGEVNPTKTEASEGTLPLDPDLAETLLQHKGQATYTADTDYVLAGDTGKPRWEDSILADYLKPAATRAKIGNVGWHTLRRTYSTLLHTFGTAPVVQKGTATACGHTHTGPLHPCRIGR
jgi:integrase